MLSYVALYHYGWVINTLTGVTSMVSEHWWVRILPIWNTEYGWGDVCINTTGRGGMCFFRVINYFAIQSYSEYAFGKIGSLS
jgi:hypothetical protein